MHAYLYGILKKHSEMRPFTVILTVLMLCTTGKPMAQNWQSLPDIPEDLAFPVVVALDGHIHVIGGGAPAGATDLHLRFTPATGTWDTLPPLPYKAQQPAGAVVNGKVHVCGGGFPTSGQRLTDHFYYDPDSSQWYAAAPLPVAIAIHKAVGYDGKLWCMSGQPNKSLCEYYDPVTDSWTVKNSLPDANFWYSALVSNGNTIFRFGGGAYFSPTAAAHRYDPSNDSWIPLPAIPQPLHAIAGTVINDSLICLSGGFGLSAETAEVWIYNTNAQTYSAFDSLPVARSYHSMVRVDSCTFSIGGHHAFVPFLSFDLLGHCGVPLSVPHPGQSLDFGVVMWNESLKVIAQDHQDLAIAIRDVTGRSVYPAANTGTGGSLFFQSPGKAGLYIVTICDEGLCESLKWLVVR